MRSLKIALRQASYALLALATMLPYQNCTSSTFNGGKENHTVQQESNGTGYEGKLVLFQNFESSNPCDTKDKFGNPLANSAIFISNQTNIALVRENCNDITPQAIAPADINVVNADAIEYKGKSLAKYDPAIASLGLQACPAGRAPLANPIRTNLMLSPLNLAGDGWGPLSASAELLGSFSGLPNYLITRTANPSEDWHRWAQWVNLKPSTMYSLSFFVKPGNTDSVRIEVYQDAPVVAHGLVDWELITGTVSASTIENLTDTSFTSTPVPGGFMVTFFFRMPDQATGLDIGIASAIANQGTSIFATGAQLEEVDSYCSN